MRRKTILAGTIAIALAMNVFTACNNADETKDNSNSTTEESHHDGDDEKCGEGKCGD